MAGSETCECGSIERAAGCDGCSLGLWSVVVSTEGSKLIGRDATDTGVALILASHPVIHYSNVGLGATAIGSYNLLDHNGPKTAAGGEISVDVVT